MSVILLKKYYSELPFPISVLSSLPSGLSFRIPHSHFRIHFIPHSAFPTLQHAFQLPHSILSAPCSMPFVFSSSIPPSTFHIPPSAFRLPLSTFHLPHSTFRIHFIPHSTFPPGQRPIQTMAYKITVISILQPLNLEPGTWDRSLKMRARLQFYT
jgi:hypothetical protein